MDILIRNRRTSLIIAILVIINLILLAAFWYSRFMPSKEDLTTTGDRKEKIDAPDRPHPKEHRREGGRLVRYLKHELAFTQEQINTFMELRNQHQQISKQLRLKMDELRQKMMNELLEENPDMQKIREIAGQLGNYLTELEFATFKHLSDVMKIGDAKQQRRSKGLLRNILHQIRPRGQGPPPGGMRPESRPVKGFPNPVDIAQTQPPGPNNRNFRHLPESGSPPSIDSLHRSQPGLHFLNKVLQQLKVTDSQAREIGNIIDKTFVQLENIPGNPGYKSHQERKDAQERLHQEMDQQIRALLSDDQKRLYDRIARNRDRHRKMNPR